MDKKHKALVGRLAEFSFAHEEDRCLERVKRILTFLQSRYPRSIKEVLHYYWTCLRKIHTQHCLCVEYAGYLSREQTMSIFKEVSCQIVYRENPQLVGGIRIKHGDWVWDRSIQGQLKALTRKLKKS
ncbi:MAG: F0F1 ATP synthase subunit delta [Puniceicoccales bacterium]|jgi:hypothetical protein|nr:F0F1 ATP synthase subunit delta [Puniceicoccales bacterium]